MFLCNSFTGWQLQAIIRGEKSQITIFPTTPRFSVGDQIKAEYMINGVECCLGHIIVTDIIRYQGNLIFSQLNDFIRDSWARAEGFSCFSEADTVYKKLYGANWKERELDCLKFRGSWMPAEAV